LVQNERQHETHFEDKVSFHYDWVDAGRATGAEDHTAMETESCVENVQEHKMAAESSPPESGYSSSASSMWGSTGFIVREESCEID